MGLDVRDRRRSIMHDAGPFAEPIRNPGHEGKKRHVGQQIGRAPHPEADGQRDLQRRVGVALQKRQATLAIDRQGLRRLTGHGRHATWVSIQDR